MSCVGKSCGSCGDCLTYSRSQRGDRLQPDGAEGLQQRGAPPGQRRTLLRLLQYGDVEQIELSHLYMGVCRKLIPTSGGGERMKKLKGLRRSPRSGGSVCLCVFSLPVLPPLAALVGYCFKMDFQKKNEAMSKGYVWDETLTIFLKVFFLYWIFLYSKLDCFKMDFQKKRGHE